jgi:hypothetical protein
MTVQKQLDLIINLDIVKITSQIKQIENAFNKIDLRRFEE